MTELVRLREEVDNLLVRYANTFLWISVLLLIMTIVWVTRPIPQLGPPITYIEARAVPTEVMQGGILSVSAAVSKNRPCHAEVQVMVATPSGVVKAILPQQGQMYQVGERVERTIEYPLPASVLPGEYALELLHSYECSDGPYLVRQTVPFTVVKPLWLNGMPS